MDKIKSAFGGGLPDEVQAMFPDGLPDLDTLSNTVSGMSEADLGSTIGTSLNSVSADDLSAFGKLLSSGSSSASATVPAGVAAGNAADISSYLTKAVSGPKGLSGGLQLMQELSGGGGMLDSVLDAVSGGKFDLVSLLKNPQILAVVGPVLSGLMKK